MLITLAYPVKINPAFKETQPFIAIIVHVPQDVNRTRRAGTVGVTASTTKETSPDSRQRQDFFSPFFKASRPSPSSFQTDACMQWVKGALSEELKLLRIKLTTRLHPSNVSTTPLNSYLVFYFNILFPPTKFIKHTFVFGFSKWNYEFFIFYMYDTCPELLSLDDSITLIFYGEYKFASSPLWDSTYFVLFILC